MRPVFDDMTCASACNLCNFQYNAFKKFVLIVQTLLNMCGLYFRKPVKPDWAEILQIGSCCVKITFARRIIGDLKFFFYHFNVIPYLTDRAENRIQQYRFLLITLPRSPPLNNISVDLYRHNTFHFPTCPGY